MTSSPSAPAKAPLLPWLLPAIALLLPLVLTFASKGTVGLLALLALGGAVECLRQRRLPLPPRTVLVAFAAALAWGALSVAWEVTPDLALHKAAQLLGLTVAGILALANAAWLTPRQRDRAVMALILGLALAAAIMVEERLTNLKLRTFLYHVRGITVVITPNVQMFMYKTAAAVCGVLAAPALGAAWQRRWWPAVVALALAVPAMAAATGSLACPAAFTLGLGLLLLKRRHAVLVVATAIVGGFVLAPMASHLPTTAEISRHIRLPLSSLHRTIIWRFAASHIPTHPILGWGLDASRELPGGEATELLTTPDGYSFAQPVLPLHPHNMFVQVWLEIGAVGAALVAAILLAVLRIGSRMDAPATAAMGAALLVSGASFGAWQSWWLAVVWMLAVLLTAMRRTPDQGDRT